MSRPLRSRVQHGMPSCARYGCRRNECLVAARRQRKRQRYARTHGHAATVSAHEAATYGRRLVQTGMSPADLAAEAGLSAKTVTDVLSGRCINVYRTTAAAVLRVAVPARGHRPTVDGNVDATAARRRLRALTALGFTLPVLAQETGSTPGTIGSLRQGRRRRLRITLDRSIAEAYDRLWDADPGGYGASPSGATRARNWARACGWAPPVALDDDRITDPTYVPVGCRDAPPRPAGHPRCRDRTKRRTGQIRQRPQVRATCYVRAGSANRRRFVPHAGSRASVPTNSSRR